MGFPESDDVASIAPQRVAQWRDRLKTVRTEVRTHYENHGSASRLLRKNRQAIEAILHSIWTSLELGDTASLVAVGGYGRGQLFPFSDVDLLILVDALPPEPLQRKLEHLVGCLWDVGLEVGHSVRTVDDCLHESAKDITVQTNLLEARFLAGNKKLFSVFEERFLSRLNPQEFMEAKVLEQQQRHGRYHDTAYNLEPNIKESPGGLRDLQTVLWIARASGIADSWEELARKELITLSEARQIRRHERFLENLRIRLHYIAGRREDRLVFDYQAALAAEFKLQDRRQRRASEQLMQRYYRTAKAIGILNEILLAQLRGHIAPPKRIAMRIIDENFLARNDQLALADEHLFQRSPHTIFDAFLLLQRDRDLKGVSPDTLRAFWRARRYITPAFRRDPQSRARFLQILSEPHGVTHILRRMNQVEILGKYLPAFGRIVGQMQHDLFHVYTVDEHILMVVRNLRRFTIPEFAHEYPLCSRLISQFPKPHLLYIAGLFHDIAKGRGGDHSELGKRDAARFCRDHGLGREDTELVRWLVESHLLMSTTAQKQDVSDPDVIANFARKVKTPSRLEALYLLTVADIRGTSPKVWNAWKGKLLEDLYYGTSRHLEGSTASPGAYLQARQLEALAILRLYAIDADVPNGLWTKLDIGYFLRHEAQEIAWHARMLLGLEDSRLPVVRARLSPAGQGLQVLIYTPDQTDLFARICSFFERTDYNIVEAKISTTRDGYALDSFIVLDEAARSPHYRDLISYVEYELTRRLQPEQPIESPLRGRISRHLKHFPIAPDVQIRPDENGSFFVVALTAGDRPGLLSRIARVFVQHGVVIHKAKIATLGERAEDTFLVTGQALETARSVLRLETDLLHAMNES